MGWISNDSLHEGYLEVVLADGTTTSTSNAAGPVVHINDDAGNYTERDEQRSDDEVVGWRLRCDCAPTSADSGSTWTGDVWQRVPTPMLEDLDAGLIYVAPGEPAGTIGERSEVGEIARARWLSIHLSPLDALAAIRQAQENIAAEGERLNEAVAHARASGQTWQTIGNAAGMSRQAAQERWRSPTR